jgi:hypothetical protein
MMAPMFSIIVSQLRFTKSEAPLRSSMRNRVVLPKLPINNNGKLLAKSPITPPVFAGRI